MHCGFGRQQGSSNIADMLDPSSCRIRQIRLLEVLRERGLEAIVIGLSPHVYYFSAHLPFWQHYAAFVLFADGGSFLVTASVPAVGMAADQVSAYEAQWFSTNRQEQPALVAEKVLAALAARKTARIGIDTSPVSAQVVLGYEGKISAIDADLWQLRRRKDADELALMRTTIDCCDAMYRRAREIIEPGISETHVFAELHAAAVEVAGEPLSAHLGNDYRCGEPGGAPRGHHEAKAGQIYILDLGPAYRGYFSDNCRAIAVDRRPTDAQRRAWEMLAGVFPIVEGMAGPGTRCRDICRAVDEHFIANIGSPMTHHLGHGVGLQPHEFPHLNPKWDDTLLEGEVFTCEPGTYSLTLAGGVRLENQYLVTRNGVQNLTPFPLELV